VGRLAGTGRGRRAKGVNGARVLVVPATSRHDDQRCDDHCQGQPFQHGVFPAPTFAALLMRYESDAELGEVAGEGTRW
jgi:hypothetical protein